MPKQDAARKEKIVLAYSGGLTLDHHSVAEGNYAYEVIAMSPTWGRETTSKPSSARRTRPEPAK